MMRWISLTLSVVLILVGVVACSPAETDTTTDANPTNEVANGDAIPDDTTNGETSAQTSGDGEPEAFVIVTRTFEEEPPEGELAIPAPGEFIASETEDPDANILFDRIFLIRSGEVNGEFVRDEIEIFPNGRYVRNGVAGLITPDDIARLQGLIVDVNFFGIQGTMLGPTADTPDFRYQLTVERGSFERLIQSHDGFMPPIYRNLLGEILLIGLR